MCNDINNRYYTEVKNGKYFKIYSYIISQFDARLKGSYSVIYMNLVCDKRTNLLNI